jgi:hypothetical protein
MRTNRSTSYGIGSILLLGMLLAACSGGGGGSSAAGNTGGGSGLTAGGGDQYGSGPDPVPDPTGNPTSHDLINTALSTSAITAEQALVYKLYADFGDTALPAQFQGDDTGFVEGDAPQQVVSYINSVGTASVSQATLDALWPFFVPAFYEGSWWHKQHPTAQKAGLPGVRYAASPNCRAWEASCSALSDWKNIPGTHVKVWYLAENEMVDGPRANMLMQEIEGTIWPKLTAVMGRSPLSDAGTGIISEIDGRLDIMLVDMPGEGLTVQANLTKCEAAAAYIYLQRTLPDRGMIAQAAHELMHAIQFSYDVAAKCVTDYYTTVEATAVWATNYVYPVNDWEHKYAKSYLAGGRVSLSYDDRSAPNTFRYGAYLLPLFLETRFGPTIVKDIWEKTAVYSQELYALDGAIVAHSSSLSKEWPKFLAAIWNRDTIDKFLKLDRLADQAELKIDDTFVLSSPSGVEVLKHPVDIPHAASAYYRIVFGDTVSRSVTIVNGLTFKADSPDLAGWGNSMAYTGLNLLERSGASMQVYLKVNGAWQSAPINMTNVPWLTVCRDDPQGKIDEIIFMYGNAEISSANPNYTNLTPRSKDPGILVTNIGCRDWTGSVSMTKPLTGGQETLTMTNIVMKNAMANTASAAPQPGGEPGTYPMNPGEQIPQPYGYVYYNASGSATWTYNEKTTNCTSTGSKSFPLYNPSPTHTFSNWTPPGPAAHGHFLTGFLGMTNYLQLSYTKSCTDSLGKVTTTTEYPGTGLDVATLIDDASVHISPGTGLSMSGTAAQTGEAATATGTWSFTGATN